MAQKQILRAEVYARALPASQNVKRAEVWVGARCLWWVGGKTPEGQELLLAESGGVLRRYLSEEHDAGGAHFSDGRV
jgi:hypothetical protein